MHLNKSAKIVLGIITFLPLLFTISILGFIIFNFFSMFFSQEPQIPMMLFSYLSYILPYLFVIILLTLGLFVFYIVHLIQNSFLDTEKRILWIVVVFLLYGFAIPIYWYIHIWKRNTAEAIKADELTNKHYEPGTQSQEF
ncbi:hypothetical protein CK503_11435 [Aliifodinibius salipaludis]|uniref:Cardiolipin synthase N-terminal domain-containing protein n=1 Tax=Fodinibius salipaludis TaxID=2032627 RepID=A0A2A2G921_9BACT|nr:hypothetical protein CK503_11435 [Aliifodinibius salipaludis]